MSKLNRLKAANFADLSSAKEPVSSKKSKLETSAKTSDRQTDTSSSQEIKKGGRPKKAAPLKRISFTLTDAQVSYLHQVVEDQLDQGLNSNISHVVRQMIQEKINK